MKKYLCLTLASAALLLPQQAFAWKNIQFGVGLNFSYQTGNNSFGFGPHRMWVNGPTPMGGHGFYGQAPMHFDHHPVQMMEAVQAAPAPSTQNTFSNPFHYSSYSAPGYHYQQPSYAEPEPFQYYGQDYWYGW